MNMTASGYQEKGAILQQVDDINKMRGIIAYEGQELVKRAAALYVYQTHQTKLVFDMDNDEEVILVTLQLKEPENCKIYSMDFDGDGNIKNVVCLNYHGNDYNADMSDIIFDYDTLEDLAEAIVNKLE